MGEIGAISLHSASRHSQSLVSTYFIRDSYSPSRTGGGSAHIPVVKMRICKFFRSARLLWWVRSRPLPQLPFFISVLRLDPDKIPVISWSLVLSESISLKIVGHQHLHKGKKELVSIVKGAKKFRCTSLIPSISNFRLSQGEALVIRYQRVASAPKSPIVLTDPQRCQDAYSFCCHSYQAQVHWKQPFLKCKGIIFSRSSGFMPH